MKDSSISLAHGWSTGPASALSDHVLGITPTEPGYRHWNLTPHPGDLTWARGAVPTPHGPIAVSWNRSGKQLTVTVTAPPDTTRHAADPRQWPRADRNPFRHILDTVGSISALSPDESADRPATTGIPVHAVGRIGTEF